MDESLFSQLLKLFFNLHFEVWGLIKLAILLGLFLYLGFALMILRQVGLMSRALNGAFSGPLKFFAWIYFIASIVIFFIAAILL